MTCRHRSETPRLAESGRPQESVRPPFDSAAARGAAAPPGFRRLSDDLHLLAGRFETRPACLREVLEVLRGRGDRPVLVLLSLPFLTPIPLPLLSTPFGAAIALIGLRLALGQPPRLPASVLEKPLPDRFFRSLLLVSSRLVRVLELVLKPRLRFLHRNEIFHRLGGGLILLSGLMLLLPLPVPFSNFFLAAAIVLLAASALEDDGLVFLLGVAACGVSAAFLGLIAVGGTAAVQQLLGFLSP